jgi:eukaryotic-like serine/threonine-protein kinase
MFADRYRLLRLVSEGANSAIYDAADQQTGRNVTLKLVRPKLAASPSFRTRFDETMRGVSGFSHPNIAAIYDWGVARMGDTSTAYLVIENLSGGSLRDMFDRGRRLTPSQALSVGLDACRGLDYAHRRGFVHGELTPSKLVFGDDRRLRIVDFGLAGLLGEQAWSKPEDVSTHVAWYASPEQGLGREIDGKTDVYALCLSLHEAVTGSLPFASDSTVQSLTARIGRLMPVSADLGPLASVFERAGRPEPEERSSASEFGKGLVGAASNLARPEPLPLLSAGLFETPIEQLRSPDDPTGGVSRPVSTLAGPEPLIVVPVDEPWPTLDADLDLIDGPITESGSTETGDRVGSDDVGDLVILPVDAEIGSVGPPLGSGVEFEAPDDGVAATRLMPAMYDEESLPRRHRRFPWKILLAVLVVGALATLGVLATQLFKTPTYVVPELVTLPEAEARNLIATNQWVLGIERERSDSVPVVGQVVRTEPAAGVELAEGEPFLIVVSEGPTLRALPDSTNLLFSEAQTALVELALAPTAVLAYDEVVLDGTVISWSVPGDLTLTTGSLVEPATPVQLIVSQGPAPRVVPNMVGVPVAEATATLEAIGLVLTEGEQVFSDDFPLGAVISQGVVAETEVTRGTTVPVVVSKGPDVVIFPDLASAANFDQAAQLLRDAGFEPLLTFGDAQGAIQSIVIAGEDPVVGQAYRRGTLVEFVAL